VTSEERKAALEAIATEVRGCTACRLHQTRTLAVPGEGSPDTEVVFVGEGPGFNDDRQGRPFVGRAGDLLVKLLGSLEWQRQDVFITNVVKCSPPDNLDPEPDEVPRAAAGWYIASIVASRAPVSGLTGWVVPWTCEMRAPGRNRAIEWRPRVTTNAGSRTSSCRWR